MLKKIRIGRMMFAAAFLILLPMMLSAAGNMEAGNSKGITLNQEVVTLLEQVESGDLTLEEAKDQFSSLEKEYQVRVEERKMIIEMMEEVGSGAKNAEECEDQLKDQLQARERINERTQTQKGSAAGDQTKTTPSQGGGDGTGKK
ncbi:MAG: hypothetical protein L3J12_08855 [Spirochaetales bacterium]|nr:hypothetical protein [Spirochaetales bacterium]